MAAHAQVTGVVEENHPGAGARVHRLAQQCADQHIAAARLQHAGSAPLIVFLGKALAALGHAGVAKVGESVGDQAGRFAAGMGVDHGNAFHRRPRPFREVNDRVACRPVRRLDAFTPRP
ncbi:hypothetical protein D3C76_1260980 [compost metagenome]